MITVKTDRRPGISQIGKVTTVGELTTVAGWSLDLCQWNCSCHRHPHNGQLYIHEDVQNGTIGLRKFMSCNCCDPWHADELAAFARDLTLIQSLTTTTEGQPF